MESCSERRRRRSGRVASACSGPAISTGLPWGHAGSTIAALRHARFARSGVSVSMTHRSSSWRSHGLWRALTRLLLGATALGAAAAGGHLLLSYRGPPLGSTWSYSLLSYVVFFVLIWGAWRVCVQLYYWSRGIAATTAQDSITNDDRAPLVFLRSFDDDDVGPRATGWWALKSFEEETVEGLRPFGPVVALADPGRSARVPGASRDRVEDWHGWVTRQLRAARCVAVVLNASAGLAWELAAVARQDALPKLVIVVPRLSRHALADRARRFLDVAAQVASSKFPSADEIAGAALLIPTSDGHVFRAVENRWTRRGHALALYLALLAAGVPSPATGRINGLLSWSRVARYLAGFAELTLVLQLGVAIYGGVPRHMSVLGISAIAACAVSLVVIRLVHARVRGG